MLFVSFLLLREKIENRIIPLSCCANIITHIIDDEKLYSSTVVNEGKTTLVNDLIVEIIPFLRDLLNVEEMIFSTLSFLSMILERNSAFVQYYKKEKVYDKIFSLMKDTNYCFNLNIIKILIRITESGYTSFDDLIKMNFIEKINSLIVNVDFQDKSIYIELVVELFYDLMMKINDEKKNYTKNINPKEFTLFLKKIEKISVNFKLCIKLLSHEISNIQEKSCVCLIFILQLLGDTFVESTNTNVKFKSSDIPDLLKGLEFNCKKIHKRMIRVFKWIIEYQDDASSVLNPYKSYITSYVENIINTCQDNEIIQLGVNLINADLKKIS